MQVMVTGGTGFIGSHTVKALTDAGHRVIMLIRDESKARRVFGNLGCSVPDFVKGDMTDPISVGRCMEGCDAVFHAAALVSMNITRGEKMSSDNRRGAETVLTEACRRGMRSIVYVSSVATLFQPGPGAITQDTPMAPALNPYARSKIESENVARSLQMDGCPIHITYPTAVIGPDDPGLSEPNLGLAIYIRFVVPNTSTGFQFIDVRDLAQIHLKLIERTGMSGRYLAGGRFMPWKDFGDMLKQLTGRRLFRLPLPGMVVRAFGRTFDAVQKIKTIDLPFSYEAMQYATRWRLVDDSDTCRSLGITYRNPEITLRDAIVWLYRSGHLKRKHIGILGRDL